MCTKTPLDLNNYLQPDIQLLQKTSDSCHTTNRRGLASNWYSSIRNHVSNGTPIEALLAYTRIRRIPLYILGVVPLVFKACASLSTIRYGKALHSESVKFGVASDVVVGTSILDMYCKCSGVTDACKLFDEMPVRNVVTWNAMIGGYMRNGATEAALYLFENMSCRTAVSWIEMIEGYARTGDTAMARSIFDQVPFRLRNVVTWTVMVDAYVCNGQMGSAKAIFEAMPERNFFVWSSMISGYLKNGDVQEGKALFNRIPVRNLVNWNSLISGYCQNGLCEEALDAFAKMQADEFEPDEVSFASALSACAQLGSLETGKNLHHMIIQRSRLNQFILNGLVDMYAKCGDLRSAKLVFEHMSERNNACWNAMISGFSIHGHCREALELFDRMEKSKVKPNEITFLSVLSACAHAGLVDDGTETFSKMEKYGLSASIKHYGCLVDLLGRAGRLKDAYKIVTEMPMRPNDTVWGALLGACRLHSDMDMANQVLKQVLDGPHHVLVSNIYAALDKWEKAESVRIVMARKGVQKIVGHSSVTVDNA